MLTLQLPSTTHGIYIYRLTYIVPQAAYAASAALCIRDKAVIQPRPRLKPSLACNHTAARNPSLPFLMVSTPTIHVNTWITTYLPTQRDGSWVGLVGWHMADNLPTKWSPINHRSGTRQESLPAKDRHP